MSTMIGSKERVAIEYELLAPSLAPQGHWMFGHMCFWFGGQAVGDYSIVATLAVALAELPDILSNTGNRTDATLFKAPLPVAFQTIFDALCVDRGQTDAQLALEVETYSRFTIVPRGLDVFDGWDAFLVESDAEARFLFRKGEAPPREFRTSRGEFDRIGNQFLVELGREFSRRPKPT